MELDNGTRRLGVWCVGEGKTIYLSVERRRAYLKFLSQETHIAVV
jgi:hypothetical protein